MEIEALYTNCMNNLNREWDTPEERQKIFDQISRNEEAGEFYRLLGVMEQAFGDPFQVTMKKVDEAEAQEDNDEKDNDENENEEQGARSKDQEIEDKVEKEDKDKQMNDADAANADPLEQEGE